MKIKIALLLLVVTIGCTSIRPASESVTSLSKLRRNGAFGFPQQEAKVLCDKSDLRFSIWNNAEYLFAQAVLWNDGDASLGVTEDNRPIGDYSMLMLDLEAAGKVTPNLDRHYWLNPWPTMPGLYYQILLDERSSTTLAQDSRGRGAIRYLELSGRRKVRVDTYLIPLAEISRRVGDRIRLCYWGWSPKPELTVNSAGYQSDRKPSYGFNIPRSQYHEYVLAEGREIDIARIPEGRNDIPSSHPASTPAPRIGDTAPEISARGWINLKNSPTLSSLRGKIVLVEFWATWCGPSITSIPHLNELHRKYAGKQFQLLSFVEEGHKTMDAFLNRTHVNYPVGLESSSLEAYGVTGIPDAFVIDQDGKIIWHGHSAAPELDSVISAALGKVR